MSDAQLAESSPAEVDSSSALDSLNSEQFTSWRMSGKLPEKSPEPETKPAESSPAAPAAPDASTEAEKPADSDPAATRKAKNGETRKAELEADIRERLQRRHAIAEEIAREEARLADLRRGAPAPDATPAASSPATADHGKPNPADATKYPEGQYDPQYIEDLAGWKAERAIQQRDAEMRQRAAHEAREKAVQQRESAFHSRLEAAVKADPDFLTKVSPEVLSLKPAYALAKGERPGPLTALADELIDSPASVEAMAFLSEHPDELKRFSEMSPRQVIRDFARLESRLTTPAADTPPAPPVNTVTSAPAPPAKLGGKPSTAPADDTASALAGGDYARYAAAANARELATKGKR